MLAQGGDWHKLTTRQLHHIPLGLDARVLNQCHKMTDVDLASFEHLGKKEALAVSQFEQRRDGGGVETG